MNNNNAFDLFFNANSLGFLLILLISSCSSNDITDGPYFGNGFHNGWADQHSIVIWTRLTLRPEMNLGGQQFIPLTQEQHSKLRNCRNRDSIHLAQIPDSLTLDDMEGACPGATGEVKLKYYPMIDPGVTIETPWEKVDPDKNYTMQWKLEGLEANTRYQVDIYAREDANHGISDTVSGTFITPPDEEMVRETRFCIVTCHDFNRRDDSIMGHKIYPSMLATVPDFYVHTGDIEYYDMHNPRAMTEEMMRFKWDRLFALPFQRQFFTEVTTYFMKDDHDALCNDVFPGMQYGTVTFERGLEIFDREQFPSNPEPYKTIRWGKDLQIWLMEGRNFRSQNHLPDGPGKTIWGEEQKRWLFRTLEASDATFKLIISPTPILGPDRDNKNDNHSNQNFSYEGEEIRQFVDQFENVFLCNGDRHWQYVTHREGTNLWEFSCGAGSDVHAGGWKQTDLRPEHRFLRVKGGFLAGKVTRLEEKVLLTFQHCDVDGRIVHEEHFETEY
ncbi:MAG: alkaline phosphatase D family protein [Bacteroidales bacterium]|nr:alkaline phosphatase D family protein [Bacteroidales bacterium]